MLTNDWIQIVWPSKCDYFFSNSSAGRHPSVRFHNNVATWLWASCYLGRTVTCQQTAWFRVQFLSSPLLTLSDSRYNLGLTSPIQANVQDRSKRKVKVKWSRYSPGVAQRVGRDIALLFHDRGSRRGEWSAARPGRTLPPGKKRCPIYRRLGGPQGRSGRAGNLVPTGIRSRTVQPVVSLYTDRTTRPTQDRTNVTEMTEEIMKVAMIATKQHKKNLRYNSTISENNFVHLP